MSNSTQKKKIVHIMLSGSYTDGWNYQDNLLTKYHVRLGYDVSIITSNWQFGNDGKLKQVAEGTYINIDSVKVIRLSIKGKNNSKRKFKRFKNLYKTLYIEEPDIIFVHNINFIDLKIIRDYVKNNRTDALFIDNHSDFSNSGKNWLSKNILHKIVWRRYAKQIEPYVTKFYGVLPARVKWLTDIYGLSKARCDLLVLGADDDCINKLNNETIRIYRSKFNIKDNDFLIVSGGKLDSSKTQILLLMKAIKKLNNDKIKLIIFGSVDKEYKDEFYSLCCKDRIIYTGWIQPEESYSFFYMADLVAFPGRHSVFWEQVVAMGKPMICKYWEGTTHIDLGGNVSFTYEDSVNEIIKVLEPIVEDNKKYENMLCTAQSEKRKKFLYSEIAKKSIGIK